VARPHLALALGIFTAACGRIQAYEQQLRAAEEARAARAKPVPMRVQVARTLHLRVYADADYRAENGNWRADVEELVQTANLLAGPQLDLMFELDGARNWERQCAAHDTAASLSELARMDEAAPDVWVVAFTGALPQLSRDLDVLGQAQALGRHVLLHGMSRLDEQDDFDMTARPLRDAERRARAQEHRRHKAALTLLHAWAHTLGGLHGGDASTVMHPSYSPEQAAFTPESAELLQFMLDLRLRHENDDSLRAAYLRWLQEHPAT
jgi:hypothetical protein